jgi:large subunit ribosomal protein L30e
MDLNKVIKNALREKRVIMGYKKVLQGLKSKSFKFVVYANNIPKDKLSNVIHNAKITKTELKEYPGNNVDLGLICGKPFSVSVLAIKGSEK